MCDLSNFLSEERKTGRQYGPMPSSYCMENYIDHWGTGVDTESKKNVKKRIGKTYCKRKDMMKDRRKWISFAISY